MLRRALLAFFWPWFRRLARHHTHRSLEYTQVLRGGFTDATGSYGAGDFQMAAGDIRHDPIADFDGDCINLAVTTGTLRFDGLVQKIVGRLFGF
ncbi:MAG TPA: cupin domain-containing protein [Rhizomicrobium sp.]